MNDRFGQVMIDNLKVVVMEFCKIIFHKVIHKVILLHLQARNCDLLGAFVCPDLQSQVFDHAFTFAFTWHEKAKNH